MFRPWLRRAPRGRGTSGPCRQELGLVDRLWSADVAELGRTVGREHDHRDVAEAGLDHRAGEVGGRGAAGAQQQCRHAAGQTDTQCGERRRPLVVEDLDPQIGQAAIASAIGVLREPGATIAVVTPSRTH